jgi:hypothetical protein
MTSLIFSNKYKLCRKQTSVSIIGGKYEYKMFDIILSDYSLVYQWIMTQTFLFST